MENSGTIFNRYKFESIVFIFSLILLSVAFLLYLSNYEQKYANSLVPSSYPQLMEQEDFDLVLGKSHKLGDKFEVEISLNTDTVDTCKEFLCVGHIEIKSAEGYQKLEGSEINLTGKDNLFSFFEPENEDIILQRVVITVYDNDLKIISSYHKDI